MGKNLLLSVFLSFILILTSIPVSIAQFPIHTDYALFIQERIYENLIYPPDAFVQGREGIVTLNFTIGQDGYLKSIFVFESSGYASLDEGAVAAVKSASPYPLPEDHEGEDVELVVPLEFRMEMPEQIEPYEPPEEWSQQEETAAQEDAESEQFQPDQEQPAEEAPKFLKKIKEGPSASEQAMKDFKVVWPEELSGFIDLAIRNNKPSQVAKKEVDLADFKVKEAMRNLLPSVKLSGYFTDGETYHVPYEELEEKIEVNQPLYYGGRLIDSIEHAKVNAEIARRNFDRMKFDIIHKTESSYYNLIASRTHWRYKEALRNEAQELLDRITKLSEIGMIIPLELNSARSSFEQIEFQLASLKQDIYLAELTFKQVLNSQDIPTINLEEPEIVKPDLDLDELFSVALKHRAEIKIGELMVKFSKYAKKIELDKDNFNVDLVGSAGLYSGHYKTEPWKNSTNWAAGIKVTKMLGASTFKGSGILERSRPRFGQTSPTASNSLSAELGLFDNMAAISSLKKTDVDLQKSISDLNETRKTVTFEVQDAFLTYQKAILQLNTASADMAFRRNQAEITKIRASVNDAPLSSAMDSLYSMADAQTKYFQALGNYFVALTNLKKATGYGINI
ncbi:MAG: TonB family protein [Candidatus Omnitrophica bacterium]|nr:TonB family protein [Candidatus Omnitrophota bacterium]